MKNFFSILLVFFVFVSFSQERNHNTISFRSVGLGGWTDANAFLFGPKPLINGYGVLSDSLENVTGTTFYELNGKYFQIATWADYYYWFVKRYPYMFNQNALLYEFYYWTNNAVEMIRFIASSNYEGIFYPSRIILTYSFPGNRLSDDSNWVQSEQKLNRLKRQINRNEKEAENINGFDNAYTSDMGTVFSNRKNSSKVSSGTGSPGSSSSSRESKSIAN